MTFNCPLFYERDFDINNWVEEYELLYKDYKKEYIEANLSFLGISIQFKRHPEIKGRYNSFYHITTGHDGPIATDEERYPDTHRISNFYYPKILIENYNCNRGCKDCTGILHWFEHEQKRIMAFIYFNDLKYIVVIEYRKSEKKEFVLFKTAYYVKYQRQRKNFLLKYEKNKDLNPLLK